MDSELKPLTKAITSKLGSRVFACESLLLSEKQISRPLILGVDFAKGKDYSAECTVSSMLDSAFAKGIVSEDNIIAIGQKFQQEIRKREAYQYMENSLLLAYGEGPKMQAFLTSKEFEHLSQWLNHVLSCLEYRGIQVDAHKINYFMKSGRVYYLLVVSDATSLMPLFTRELSLVEYAAIKHNKLFD